MSRIKIVNLKKEFSIDSHGFIIVVDTDVAAVGHIQTVPGPGLAIVAVVAGRGTVTDGGLPADRNITITFLLITTQQTPTYLVTLPTNSLLLTKPEAYGVPECWAGAST